MIYGLLADLVVIIHLSFVLFAVFGGFAVYRWRRVLILHLAAVVWAVIVEVFGLLCPLTPLENRFRRMAGQEGYETDFIDRYIMQLLYPENLTRETQILLGCAVLAINVLVYAFLWKRVRENRG
jgi:hypothetical protein